MSLALMPGSEPIAVQVTEPEPAPPVLGGSLIGVGGAIQGCDCMSCVQLRSSYHEQRRATMTVQYSGFGQRADMLVVDEASDYPQGMPSGMIRGRYDMSQSAEPTSWFHGQVRWRQPGTMFVFDSEGRGQWTYDEEMPDGTLVDRQNRRWVPDSARRDVYAEIATAMPMAAAAPPAFDWGTYDPDGPLPQLYVTRRPS